MSSPASTPCPDFTPFARQMEAAGVAPASISAFRRSYELLAKGETGQIPENSILPVDDLPAAPGILPDAARTRWLLERTCLLKLNGGLGTGMGLDGPKSLLEIKEGLTFLDLICRQVENERRRFGALAFLLMNSFSTSAETLAFVRQKYPSLAGAHPTDFELLQDKVPKVDAATLAPAQSPGDPDLAWCPAGHGALYAALSGSGQLAELLSRGIRYLFVSNADNLGATLDLSLLDDFAASGAPFLMEVTARTAADRKGGHLCRDRATGHLCLREVAQCPAADLAPFQDIGKHRFFNTNNLWIDLEQLRAALEKQGGSIPLPVIFNAKTVDPRDPASAKVIQLETAMGAAIEAFDGARAVIVPRTRFLPVKTTNELLALRSDAYGLNAECELRLETSSGEPPLVDLDPAHYKRIDQLDALTAIATPSLAACRRLQIKGPIVFDDDIIFEGEVEIINPSAERRQLPPGRYENRRVEV